MWERLVEACEAPDGSAPKEPSARARMVTERLRKLDEEAARGQRRRFRGKREPEPWQPEGRRTGPAWQETEGGGRGGRLGRVGTAIGATAVALALLYALNPSFVRSWMPGGEPGAPEPLPAETAAPAAAPEEELLPDLPTVDAPFAGSPALRWADGADAIVLPEATAVGDVPATAIEAALRRTKRFLVAANLDRRVLMGAEPTEALDLMDPLLGETVTELRKALAEPTVENDPKWMFTRFDRDEVRLAGDVVKVRGRMEVTEGERGVPRVRADYTFVYPLARAEGGEEVARTIVRRSLEIHVPHGPEWEYTEGRLWVAGYGSRIANDVCESGDGFIHPMFVADRYARPAPSGPERDPYDRSEPIAEGKPDEGQCGVVTRT
ncbi:hypothetical protein F0L17_24510 [Streptomyces sp. TRM43335]|uniref:Uncharacterized protein n=1 Tax=Streptomyces taklimakanensis TaxID=2569853 RepID=A0A6G2BJ13_9ACTN|nr:hypothetical protein [Streptomyces taklimakanensis]